MLKVTDISNLAEGGLFSSSDEFDLAVRRLNQDLGKLVIFAKRNKTTIQQICLLQARENSRIRASNKGKKRDAYEKPNELCKGA